MQTKRDGLGRDMRGKDLIVTEERLDLGYEACHGQKMGVAVGRISYVIRRLTRDAANLHCESFGEQIFQTIPILGAISFPLSRKCLRIVQRGGL